MYVTYAAAGEEGADRLEAEEVSLVTSLLVLHSHTASYECSDVEDDASELSGTSYMADEVAY